MLGRRKLYPEKCTYCCAGIAASAILSLRIALSTASLAGSYIEPLGKQICVAAFWLFIMFVDTAPVFRSTTVISKGSSLREQRVSNVLSRVISGEDQGKAFWGYVGSEWNEGEASQKWKEKVKELEYAYSNRIVSENIAIAAFEALYADWKGIAVVDTTDVWLTIIPLDLSSKGKSACVMAS